MSNGWYWKLFSTFLISVIFLGVGCALEKGGKEKENREGSTSGVQSSRDSQQTTSPRAEVTVIEPEQDYPNGVRLRAAFKPGEKVTRKIKGTIEVHLDEKQLRKGEKPKATSQLEVVYTSLTRSMQNGIAELEISSAPVKVQTGSGEPGYWQAENSIVKIDECARVFSETTNVVRGIHGIGFIPFPKKRVIPGSTWKSVTNREVPLLGLMRVTEKYTYKGIQDVNGEKTWRIDLLVQDSAKRFGSSGSYFFDSENGQLVEATVTMRFEGDIETPTGQKRHAKVIFFVRVEPFEEKSVG